MKYPAHIYAKALIEVLAVSEGSKSKEEAAGKNFIALIKKNGDEAHLKKILEEASRMARAKTGMRKVTVASARALSASQKKTMDHFIKSGDVVEHEIDPELIAGIKITVNDEMQFDGSLRNKLNKVLGSV